MPLGEDHYRRVRDPKLEVAVAVQDDAGTGNVHMIEGFKAVDARLDLLEEAILRCRAHARGEQVVKLGQDEGREDPWPSRETEGGGRRTMVPLAAVDRRQQPARVEKNHRSPKPFIASSTCSERSG